MEIVIIESPFAANKEHSQKEHIVYSRRCLKDSLVRGEAPFASHLLYTQEGVLNDDNPEERRKGIEAGFAYRKIADKTAVYVDYGTSGGMRQGIKHAVNHGQVVEFRTIGRNPFKILFIKRIMRTCSMYLRR